MPLYAYEDPETGLRIDLRRPVEERNKPIVLRRVKTVPDRVGVIIAGQVTEASDFNTRMLKEHHKKEEREGSRFRSGFSKEQIKKAWAA